MKVTTFTGLKELSLKGRTNLGFSYQDIARDLNELKTLESNLGYKNSVADDPDPSLQLERDKKTRNLEFTAEYKYTKAEKELRKYLPIVKRVLTNGFLNLPEEKQNQIIGQVRLKVKDIASSTGLIRQKVSTLTEIYVGKIDNIFYHTLAHTG